MLSTDSSFPSSHPCERADGLRDYAFDELSGDERSSMEQHLATCGDCTLELNQLRLTTAALRTMPDREIPQRIAFVSDRVFQPSVFARFWSSSARLGFASACVLAVAMLVSAWHFSAVYRPTEARPVAQTASISPDQINAAVAKAVAEARSQIANDETQVIRSAVEASERKRDTEYRSQLVALEESYMVLQKRLGTSYTSYARLTPNEAAGAGQ